jgi:CRP-like cAMP-binding protein
MKNVSGWLLEQLLSDDGRHNATIRSYEPGETVFRVGDAGDYLAVLLSGCVEIRKGTQLISVVEPGSMFGEMGIIDQHPRVADAIAKNPSRIAEIREGQFTNLLRMTPEFGLAIMRLLTDRVRRKMET